MSKGKGRGYIGWGAVAFLAGIAGMIILASLGWGLLVHWIAHCA